MAQKQPVGLAIAKFDYRTNDSHELNINKGEKLTLLNDSQHWWQVMNSRGETGFVPSNFCKRSKQGLFSSLRNTLGRKSKSKDPPVENGGGRSLTASPSNTHHPLSVNRGLKDGAMSDESIDNRGHDSHQRSPFQAIACLKQATNEISVNNKVPKQPIVANALPKIDSELSGFPRHKAQHHNGSAAAPRILGGGDHEASSEGPPGRGETLQPQTCVAKFSYSPCQPDELALCRGDEIRVLERSSDGWWRGEVAGGDGPSGWFPSNYVTLDLRHACDSVARHAVAAPPPPLILHGHPHGSPPTAANQQPRRYSAVLALYPFARSQPEELSFQANEVLEVLERPEDDPDWWRCRNAGGQVGLVPRNYVRTTGVPADDDGDGANDVDDDNGRTRARPPWLWPAISRLECEALLISRGYLGQFVVRDSESHPGDLTITMHAGSKCRNFKIHLDSDDTNGGGGGQYHIGQKAFPSVEVLIQHYRSHPIYKTDSERLFLSDHFQRTAATSDF